jgi:hypothetical protein
MSPKDFEELYRKLDVELDDGTSEQVDVHKYQLNGKNNASALIAKDKLLGKIQDEHRTTKKDVVVDGDSVIGKKVDIALCFMGKGSPDDLALTLRLVSRYDLEEPGDLQGYADANLGLDCNGFVGNYAKEEGSGLGPSTHIDVFRQQGQLRTQIEDVDDNDVLVWKNTSGGYGHIAIIDDRMYGPWDIDRKIYPQVVVVESNGSGGLHDSVYTIESAKVDPATSRTVFTVGRPDGTKHLVYIVNLNL